jgi:hypothetical protein
MADQNSNDKSYVKDNKHGTQPGTTQAEKERSATKDEGQASVEQQRRENRI